MNEYVLATLTLLGGVCVFLFGMNIMGDGLERRAGNALKSILGKLTNNKFLGFLTGLFVTAMIQSSSATTVMIVGFVNIGAMGLSQALYVILGSAVGTTITAWITSIPIVEVLTAAMAIGGIVFVMFLKGDKNKDIGSILLGFAVLMTGLEVMSGAVGALKESKFVEKMFSSFQDPFVCVGIGTVITALIQSSSASSVILQRLADQGLVTFRQSIPIIFGLNIGTTITALIACVGANKNAKRAAIAHLIMKAFGAIVGVIVFYIIIFTGSDSVMAFLGKNPTKVQIAICHTSFNLANTLLLFPLCGVIEKLVCVLIKDKDEQGQENVLLDEKLITVPAVALERSKVLATELGVLATDTLKKSLTLLENYDSDLAKQIKANEGTTDDYEDILGKYLVKLSSTQIGEKESLEVSKLLKAINDFERIGDHALNVLDVAEELREKDLAFSENAKSELKVITKALNKILDMTVEAFTNNDLALAEHIEPLEEVIDKLKEQMRARHVVRMQQQKCSIEVGFVWVDLLTSLERVSDHCSNIAIGVIDNLRHRVNSHEFAHTIKHEEPFKERYKKYSEEFKIVGDVV